MASNKELMADITTLCLERGVAVPDGLEQLKQPKLLELLDGLRRAEPPADASDSAPVVETALRPLVAPSPPDSDERQGTGVEPRDAAPAPTPVSTPAPSPVAQEPAAPPAAAQATGASGYFVAEGKTVDPGTGRDRQGAFQQVYPSDFAGGLAELEALRAAGYLFKR